MPQGMSDFSWLGATVLGRRTVGGGGVPRWQRAMSKEAKPSRESRSARRRSRRQLSPNHRLASVGVWCLALVCASGDVRSINRIIVSNAW
jgi:hypothetical protein